MDKHFYKGVACIVASAFSFALMGVFVRAAGDIHFLQKAFFRNAVAFIVAMTFIIQDRKHIFIPKGCVKFLFLRSATGVLGIMGNFYALDRINISDALMLNKMSPFFAVIFSLIFLGERIKPLPFVCTIVAFLGSLLVIRPTSDLAVSFPAIFAFIGGMGAGAAYACVRKLGSMKITGSVIVAFFSAFSCLVSVPHLITHFEAMSPFQWAMLLGCGVAAAGGQFGITYAYYYAPPRDISIFDYSNIVFASILGFFVFGQVPTLLSILGYTVIIGAAVAVFFYNKKAQ